jgi:hypothetical protein
MLAPASSWPKCREFEAKRLMGFEPTTFCMATPSASEVFRTGTSQFAGDLRTTQSAFAASMRLDMRRYAVFRETSGQKFPKSTKAVPIDAPPSRRELSGKFYNRKTCQIR